MNNNLEESIPAEDFLIPVGDFNIESVFNFFNIAPENRELFKNALLDIVGLYTTIEWDSNKYVTINLLKTRDKRGNPIYNVNNSKTTNKTKKIIVDYNPYNNANSLSNSYDLEDILKTYTGNSYNDNKLPELLKLVEEFNLEKESISKLTNIDDLIEKYGLHHLFQTPKQYILDSKTLQLTEGAIVKSQTTGNSFVLLEPLFRTLKLNKQKPRKIYIYKKTTENVYYIYSNWGEIRNYTRTYSFEKKLIEYMIEYIKYIISRYQIDVNNSKFVFAGHSEGANVSQNLIVKISRNQIIPNENLFLISLSYPQSLSPDDLTYLYNNLECRYLSLVAMGYLQDRNSKNNVKITKKNIKNNKVMVNNFTKIHNSLPLLKSLCIFFDYNRKKYIPKAIYNLEDYMKIIENENTYALSSRHNNNHNRRKQSAHKFHNFTEFIKSAIMSLILSGTEVKAKNEVKPKSGFWNFFKRKRTRKELPSKPSIL
jgi:hypothetical protein